ncbi:MAG: hypothetical protein DMF84_11280 [Acidobacteria bacterium]|nr:MAG: hypothetical protein DMF84_11280 [Acidobacteriota bacterium]
MESRDAVRAEKTISREGAEAQSTERRLPVTSCRAKRGDEGAYAAVSLFVFSARGVTPRLP